MSAVPTTFLAELGFVLLATQLFAALALRFSLPAVIGELVAGIAIGLIALGFPALSPNVTALRESEALQLLAELGLVFLLFEVGLQLDFAELRLRFLPASAVALVGVIAPFVLVLLLWPVTGLAWSINAFWVCGLTLAATSIGITASVFQSMNLLQTVSAQVVLGAAVLDDILGLLLLACSLPVLLGGAFDLGSVFSVLFKIVLFLGFALLLAPRLFSSYLAPLCQREGKQDDLALGVLLSTYGLALAALGQLAGLAPIIGAFVAGLSLQKEAFPQLERLIAPLRALFAPLFFFGIGLSLDLAAPNFYLAFLLTGIAIVSKLVSGFVCSVLGKEANPWLVGVGMMPRGEVGLVVMAIAASQGLLSEPLYSSLLIAVIASSVIAPLWLIWLVKKSYNLETVIDNHSQ